MSLSQLKANMRNMFDTTHFKNDLVAACGEFIGTVLFLLLALGGCQASATSVAGSTAAASTGGSASINTVASVDQLSYQALSFGLALMVSAWLFFRVTGGAFNPNVSLALVLIGAITPLRFVLYCIFQMLGAIVASALLQAMLPGGIAVTPALGAGTTAAGGVFIEMFCTAALCFAVLMLAAEKHASTFLAPVGIGLTLFAGHMWSLVYTGSGINYARAFGPAVITGFSSDHWIYFVGDGLGSFLAVGIYACLKMVQYPSLNPQQDSTSEEHNPQFMSSPPRLLSRSISGRSGDRKRTTSNASEGDPRMSTGGETVVAAERTMSPESMLEKSGRNADHMV